MAKNIWKVMMHPRMLFAKSGLNWPSGAREDENVKSIYMYNNDKQQISIRRAYLSL